MLYVGHVFGCFRALGANTFLCSNEPHEKERIRAGGWARPRHGRLSNREASFCNEFLCETDGQKSDCKSSTSLPSTFTPYVS